MVISRILVSKQKGQEHTVLGLLSIGPLKFL